MFKRFLPRLLRTVEKTDIERELVSRIMPPKKRPLAKTKGSDIDSKDHEEAPIKPKKLKKNETEEQLEVIEDKPKKKRAPAKKEEEEVKEEPTENKRKQTKGAKKETSAEVVQNEEEEIKEAPTVTKRKPPKTTKKETSNEAVPIKSKDTKTEKKETKKTTKENSEETKKQKNTTKKEEQTESVNEEMSEGEPENEPTEIKVKRTRVKKDASVDVVQKKSKDAKPVKKDNKKTTEKKNAKEAEEKKDKPAKKKIVKKESTENEEHNDKEKKNNTETNWKAIDFDCDKMNADGNASNMKIISWNVGGMKSWLKKDCLNILPYASPDILCLQETKCNSDMIPKEINDYDGYHKFWCSSDKHGYAGVGLLTKKEPSNVTYGIGDEEQDVDGRCITAEFDEFFLVNVYVPNAGRKLVTLDKRLAWNQKFKDFIVELDKQKPVIICGDLNVAHNEIDLANPSSNKMNAGFTQEERDGMSDFLEAGFLDTFRDLYPEKADSYTFWTYMMGARKRNIGWRLDYFLVSERIKNMVCDSKIHPDVFGSDHCPLTLFINI